MTKIKTFILYFQLKMLQNNMFSTNLPKMHLHTNHRGNIKQHKKQVIIIDRRLKLNK